MERNYLQLSRNWALFLDVLGMYVFMNIGWVAIFIALFLAGVIGAVGNLGGGLDVLAVAWGEKRPRKREGNVLYSVLSTRIAETNWFQLAW